MRSSLKITVSVLLALTTGMTVASAQTAPDAIKGWTGLSYLGVVAGLEAWGVEGSDRLWLRAPDGRGIIQGHVFAANGQDIGAAMTGGPAQALSPGVSIAPTIPQTAEQAVTDPPLDWSQPSEALIAEALEITRGGAFWFGVGEVSAPEVWAWIDPGKPAAIATFMMLRERIADGSIYLRVIPVVTRDPASANAMAALLSSEDPLRSFLARLDGGALPTLPSEADMSLPEDLVAAIEGNGSLASRIAPPALPFLIWTGPKGPAALAGIPGDDIFGDVVRVDPVPEPDLEPPEAAGETGPSNTPGSE